MGYVYLLLEVDKDGYERHKIGITKRKVSTRVKELQTGNSNVISILKSYESINYQRVEHWLHQIYANQKTETDNEWFLLTDEQVNDFIKTCEETESKVKYLIENNPFFGK